MHTTHPLDLGFFEPLSISPPPDPVGPLVGVGVQTGGGELTVKSCSKCGLVLPLTQFHKWNDRKKGVVVVRSECNKCKRKQIEAWEKQNPDRVLAYKIKSEAKALGISAAYLQQIKDTAKGVRTAEAAKNKQRIEERRRRGQFIRNVAALNWAIRRERPLAIARQKQEDLERLRSSGAVSSGGLGLRCGGWATKGLTIPDNVDSEGRMCCVVCSVPFRSQAQKGRKTCGKPDCKNELLRRKRIQLVGYDYDPRERKRQRNLAYGRALRTKKAGLIRALYRAHYAESAEAKAKQRERRHKRKAILLAATHDDTAKLAYKLLLSNATSCHWCGCGVSHDTMEIDHYIPLTRGGEHAGNNLVASCARCNRQRGNKLPGEYVLWLQERTDNTEMDRRYA